MAVKPQIQELLNQIAAVKPMLAAIGYKFTQTNIREAFAVLQYKYVTDIDYSIVSIDDIIYNEKYPVAVRIYRPCLDKNLPVAIFIHGGGHMTGSVSQYDGIARKLAKSTQHLVVSIEYRLSPEFGYPVGLNDCRTVIENIFAVLDQRKIGYLNKELTLIGDSAGGALCATLSSDEKLVQRSLIKKQVLIYPALDYTLSSESYTKHATGYLLELDKIKWYYDNYLQNNEDRYAISPLFKNLHQDMPETLIIAAGYDPLVDEDCAYYEKLCQAKVKSELLLLDNMVHAFLSIEDLCKEECSQVYDKIRQWMC